MAEVTTLPPPPTPLPIKQEKEDVSMVSSHSNTSDETSPRINLDPTIHPNLNNPNNPIQLVILPVAQPVIHISNHHQPVSPLVPVHFFPPPPPLPHPSQPINTLGPHPPQPPFYIPQLKFIHFFLFSFFGCFLDNFWIFL